ncbi:MAG TPA: FxsA family protein [Pelomicrobium sp.]|nr:FxsA family protein [Pelomicrobium sp.]
MPALLILFLLLLFPAVEVVLLVQIAEAFGAGWTLALVAAGAVVGWALIRGEQAAFRGRLRAAIDAGANPLVTILASGRRFVAGALFLFPGVISDVLALLALLVPIRDRKPPPPGDGVIEGEYRRLD